jgi:uncharacterized protein YdaU (DUF1376 family)
MGLPYFPFYVNDFLGSRTVACLTLEQIGAYTLLLAHAWGDPDCLLPTDENELMALTQNKLSSSQALAGLMKRAFTLQAEPKPGYFNPRLREVKRQYENHSKAMSLAGKKGAEYKKILKLKEKDLQAKLKPGFSQAEAKHKLSLALSSSSSIASSSSKSLLKKAKTICPDALRLSGLMADLILQHTPDHKDLSNGSKDKTTTRWARDIDLMLRIDKRIPDGVEKTIIFAHTDSFWFKNILSGAKLREKYDQLGMNMKQPGRQKLNKHEQIDQWLQETYYAKQ